MSVVCLRKVHIAHNMCMWFGGHRFSNAFLSGMVVAEGESVQESRYHRRKQHFSGFLESESWNGWSF